MAESATATRCVHCLADLIEETADHWFPRSWYPSSTPANLEKWTFPSCSKCNGELGAIEDRLKERLALGIDPQAAAGRGVVDSALRAVDPAHGRDERDRRARAARRAALERELIPGDQLPMESVLPGLGPSDSMPLRDQRGRYVTAAELHRFVAKLVKGLTWLQVRRYFEGAHVIDVRFYRPADARLLTDLLDRRGETIERGPGIRARVARDAKDPLCASGASSPCTPWCSLEIECAVWPPTDRLALTSAGSEVARLAKSLAPRVRGGTADPADHGA